MSKPFIRNLEHIRSKDPKLAEAFDDVIKAIQNHSEALNVDPNGGNVAPQAPQKLEVHSNGAGLFDMKISDHNDINRGISYFVEHDTNPSFTAPRTIELGSSRNETRFLGNQTLYFRARAQYNNGGPPSDPVHHGGTNPTPVKGGGTIAFTSPLTSGGTGTSAPDGRNNSFGAGSNSFRSKSGKRPILSNK